MIGRTLYQIATCERCSHDAIIVTLALALAAVAVSFSGLCFLFVHWKKPIMILAQRWFILGVFIGAMFLSASRLLYVWILLDSFNSPWVCWVENLLLFPPIVFIVTSITVKEWKVYHIYKSTMRLARAKSINKRLYAYVGVSVLVSAGLSIAGRLVNPVVGGSFSYTTESGQLKWVAPCDPNPLTAKTKANIFVSIMLAQVLLHLIIVIVVGCKSKDVPTVAGESKSIFAMSICIFFGFAAGAVLYFYFYSALRTIGPLSSDNPLFGWSYASMTAGVLIMVVPMVYTLGFRKLRWINDSNSDLTSKFVAKNDLPSYTVSSRAKTDPRDQQSTVPSVEGGCHSSPDNAIVAI
mmetsp:Transcript_20701/g.34153  ORF Transcript_20701/g.34153 Transcript_20701/m.34153 type:complete len:351 (+) Transcript_20701:345-1397(+)